MLDVIEALLRLEGGDLTDLEASVRDVLNALSKGDLESKPVLQMLRLLRNGIRHMPQLQCLLGSNEYSCLLRVIVDSPSLSCQLEAGACLVNGMLQNSSGFMAFEQVNGMSTILNILEGSCDGELMQRLFRVLNICFQNMNSLVDEEARSRFEEMHRLLSELSVSCLACCVRCPAFKQENRFSIELCLEILSLQLLLGSETSPEMLTSDNKSLETNTQLGMILTELLIMPIDRPFMQQIKSKIVSVLVYMPPEFSFFLFVHQALRAILESFEIELHVICISHRKDAETRALPYLVVLHKLVEKNPQMKIYIESIVFKDDDSNVQEKPSMNSVAAIPGSFLSYLLQLNHSTFEAVSRMSGEFLWILCDENSDVFVRRTGLGNAVGMLQVKGLMSM